MTMESDLRTVLATASGLPIYPDTPPAGLAPPYGLYGHIGGMSLRYTEGTAAPLRHSQVQITVWTTTRAATLATIRAIEDALCIAPEFIARPLAEPVNADDAELGFYGSHQDFDIWAPR